MDPTSNEPPLNIKNPVSDPEPKAQSKHESESARYFPILNDINSHKLILKFVMLFLSEIIKTRYDL